MFDSLINVGQDFVRESFAELVFGFCDKNDFVVTPRDSRNAPSTPQVSPIMPSDVASMGQRNFYNLLNQKKARLSYQVSSTEIIEIESFECFIRD